MGAGAAPSRQLLVSLSGCGRGRAQALGRGRVGQDGARRERILGEEVCGRVGRRAAVNAGTLGIDGALGQLALPLHPAPAGDKRTVLVPNALSLFPTGFDLHLGVSAFGENG